MNDGNFRRRKNYFECSKSHKLRLQELIRQNSYVLSNFCASIGLKIDQIILSRREELRDLPRCTISVLPQISSRYKTFKCLKAKDLSNLSRRNYSLFVNTLKDIIPFDIPGIKLLQRMQNNLNNTFRINLNENQNGFYFNIDQKFRYVIEKFLNSNRDFAENSNEIKIKLSTDSVKISRKNTILLNFAFNLIDDTINAMGVHGTFVIGMFTKIIYFYFWIHF
jgi:hypothetical protein